MTKFLYLLVFAIALVPCSTSAPLIAADNHQNVSSRQKLYDGISICIAVTWVVTLTLISAYESWEWADGQSVSRESLLGALGCIFVSSVWLGVNGFD